jgi:hypothetical protein
MSKKRPRRRGVRVRVKRPKRRRRQMLIHNEFKGQPPKPKTLYEALERTRDSGGLYHPPAVEKERYPGPTKERNPKPKNLPKQNKNRWGRNPFSSLQSAGMPGNEETDPRPIRG